MTEIVLAGGQIAVVDDEDFDVVSQYSWHLAAGRYAASDDRNFARTSGEYLYMHVLVARLAGLDTSRKVDHRDNNGLNNRRSNLRWATHSQNLANRGPQRNNTSGFKGVTWVGSKRRWMAQIKVNQKRIGLGYFVIKEDAARAYNRAAKQHFGAYAYQNPL
jgi:hypothetical protein